MKNIKKALVFVVAVLFILAFANFSFASSITAKNSTNTSTNSSENSSADNSTDNTSSNNSTDNTPSNNSTSNRITNSSSNGLNSVNQSSNTAKSINTTNSSEDLPHTGIDKTYFNFAMILLLALVLSMFSLVQYNKISKKDE